MDVLKGCDGWCMKVSSYTRNWHWVHILSNAYTSRLALHRYIYIYTIYALSWKEAILSSFPCGLFTSIHSIWLVHDRYKFNCTHTKLLKAATQLYCMGRNSVKKALKVYSFFCGNKVTVMLVWELLFFIHIFHFDNYKVLLYHNLSGFLRLEAAPMHLWT